MEPTVIYAYCSVIYEGRASSILEVGNYLIICKQDGAVMIHGSTLLKPLNFQPPGAEIERTDNKIICRRNKEEIIINIESIHFSQALPGWSNNKIKLVRTEDDLRNKIIADLPYLLGRKIISTEKEHKTEYGPIDILAIDENQENIVIEVKRAKADIKACSQLERYLKVVPGEGWLMSPAISSGAHQYCRDHGLNWKEVSF